MAVEYGFAGVPEPELPPEGGDGQEPFEAAVLGLVGTWNQLIEEAMSEHGGDFTVDPQEVSEDDYDNIQAC